MEVQDFNFNTIPEIKRLLLKDILCRLGNEDRPRYVVHAATNPISIMKLLMYLENDLIGAIPLCRESLSLPGYIGKMKRQLKEKYISLIKQAENEPEFLVVNVSKRDNPLRSK